MDIELQDGGAKFPSFCMLDLFISDLAVEYAFVYNGTRFYVTIKAEKLKGEGEFLDEFNKFKDGIDDPDTMFQFEEWILSPLDDFMLKVAPTPEHGTWKTITLLDYFSPPTYAFALVNQKGSLYAIQEDYNPQIHGDISPRTRIIDPSPHSSLGPSSANANPPPDHGVLKEGSVLRSELPPVPLIYASELERADELRDKEMSDVPRKVRRRGSGDVFFFKAGFKDHGHLRELELLCQINHSGEFDAHLRTSKLLGLVVWDDDETSLMGFLLEYIDGETLALRMESTDMATRTKWMSKIEATVRQLHRVGIVWGDVKPDNVMINADGDAVVVDFGGGYTPEYIKPELQNTAQGDLMGLEHTRVALG